MNEELATQHAKAARTCGNEKSCGNKIRLSYYAKAASQAKHLNESPRRRHEVEPYFCVFCSGWHVGRIFSQADLLTFAMIADMVDDGLVKKKDERVVFIFKHKQ